MANQMDRFEDTQGFFFTLLSSFSFELLGRRTFVTDAIEVSTINVLLQRVSQSLKN